MTRKIKKSELRELHKQARECCESISHIFKDSNNILYLKILIDKFEVMVNTRIIEILRNTDL